MKRTKLAKLLVATALCAGSLTAATRVEAVSQCPRKGILCTDQYDPVICSNGKVYSNSCYAYVACATGCVPYGAV
ncbi:MAG TPA: hypothetical protein VHU81_03990 [Thermoanaerobaculia bacterium]|jgi:hypothetical protein|nr:hypothetical protein [Thermoanaerobaculia bacterium]